MLMLDAETINQQEQDKLLMDFFKKVPKKILNLTLIYFNNIYLKKEVNAENLLFWYFEFSKAKKILTAEKTFRRYLEFLQTNNLIQTVIKKGYVCYKITEKGMHLIKFLYPINLYIPSSINIPLYSEIAYNIFFNMLSYQRQVVCRYKPFLLNFKINGLEFVLVKKDFDELKQIYPEFPYLSLEDLLSIMFNQQSFPVKKNFIFEIMELIKNNLNASDDNGLINYYDFLVNLEKRYLNNRR